jgi:hypothetical protein
MPRGRKRVLISANFPDDCSEATPMIMLRPATTGIVRVTYLLTVHV